MKRVEMERAAIARAIESAPNKNITIAAERLGASRRTLQNRMRDYGMPKGPSGRPRELLSYNRSPLSLSTVVVVGVGFALGYYLLKSNSERVDGGVKSSCLRGLDIITR